MNQDSGESIGAFGGFQAQFAGCSPVQRVSGRSKSSTAVHTV